MSTTQILDIVLLAWLIGIPAYWLLELTRVGLKNAFGIEDSHNVRLDLQATEYLTLHYLPKALLWPLVTLGSTWLISVFHLGLWIRNRRTTDGEGPSR